MAVRPRGPRASRSWAGHRGRTGHRWVAGGWCSYRLRIADCGLRIGGLAAGAVGEGDGLGEAGKGATDEIRLPWAFPRLGLAVRQALLKLAHRVRESLFQVL